MEAEFIKHKLHRYGRWFQTVWFPAASREGAVYWHGNENVEPGLQCRIQYSVVPQLLKKRKVKTAETISAR